MAREGRRYEPGVRDKIVVGLANALLKLASPQYRELLQGTIRYGFKAAARDATSKGEG